MTFKAIETIESNRRIASLDFLRGLAALSVAVSHYYRLTYESRVAEMISVISVEIFFPLSGFVLAQQILSCQKDSRHLPIFYIRRWMRTIPPYLFAVGAMAILTQNLFTFDLIKYIFFIQNMAPNYLEVDFYPLAWSLAIEEFYYLLFPLFIIFTPKKKLFIFLIVFLCFFQLLRILTSGMFDPQFVRIGTFFRIDSIALGFFFFCFFKDKMNSSSSITFLIILGISTAILAFSVSNNPENYTYRLLFISISSFFGALCVLSLYNFRKFFSGKAVAFFSQWFGKISYPIYLFHIPVLSVINAFGSSILSSFPIYLILLLSFSLFLNITFEKPILDARPDYNKF